MAKIHLIGGTNMGELKSECIKKSFHRHSEADQIERKKFIHISEHTLAERKGDSDSHLSRPEYERGKGFKWIKKLRQICARRLRKLGVSVQSYQSLFSHLLRYVSCLRASDMRPSDINTRCRALMALTSLTHLLAYISAASEINERLKHFLILAGIVADFSRRWLTDIKFATRCRAEINYGKIQYLREVILMDSCHIKNQLPGACEDHRNILLAILIALDIM
jgi:hypothetical protein